LQEVAVVVITQTDTLVVEAALAAIYQARKQ
jgi:hypothetical protein